MTPGDTASRRSAVSRVPAGRRPVVVPGPASRRGSVRRPHSGRARAVASGAGLRPDTASRVRAGGPRLATSTDIGAVSRAGTALPGRDGRRAANPQHDSPALTAVPITGGAR